MIDDSCQARECFQNKFRKKYLSFGNHNYATLPPLKILHTFSINHKIQSMSENNGIFIVRSIANTVNTISELDALITNEQDEVHINELKKRREQLIQVLKELAQELNAETKPLD